MDQFESNVTNEKNEEFLDELSKKVIRLTKAPSFSKPKLLSKNENKDEESQASESETHITTQVTRKPKKIRPKPTVKAEPPKLWSETKIYVLPLMPSDVEEKYVCFYFILFKNISIIKVFLFSFSLARIRSTGVRIVMNCVIKPI